MAVSGEMNSSKYCFTLFALAFDGESCFSHPTRSTMSRKRLESKYTP